MDKNQNKQSNAISSSKPRTIDLMGKKVKVYDCNEPLYFYCFYCGKVAGPGKNLEDLRKIAREIGLKRCKVSSYTQEGYICKQCRANRREAGKVVIKIGE